MGKPRGPVASLQFAVGCCSLLQAGWAAAQGTTLASDITTTTTPTPLPSWMHPVCVDFPCTVSEDADPAYTLSVDPTACVVLPGNATTKPSFNCPMCLANDPTFAPLLKQLGAGTVPRDKLKLVLMFDNWLSSIFGASITSILLREVMGFKALRTSSQTYNEMQTLCCPDRTLMGIEMWPLLVIEDIVTPAQNVSRSREMVSSLLGTTGYAAFWVADWVMERMPLLTTYQALKLVPSYMAAFPRAFSTPCEQLLVDASLGCVAGNYVCDTNTWAEGSCDRGRFVPPQCQGTDPGSGLPRASFCIEVLMADPNWDPGFFEGLTTNIGLNFTLAYLGTTRLPAYAQAQSALGVPQIFYWYTPDPLIAQLNAKAIGGFKPSTPACQALQSPTPQLNKGDCDYRHTALLKSIRRRDVAAEPDLAYLLQLFHFTDDDMSKLLLQHVAAGGTMQAYDIACGWLKNNTAVWRDWVKNTAEVTTDAGPALELSRLGGGIGGSVGALLVAITLVLLLLRWRASRANQAAPMKTPFAIVFTDIQSSSALWEAYPEAMGAAVEQHHAIMRQAIEDFGAYEVKTVGDSFMIAVGSTVEAILMAAEMQTKLMEADWPDAVLHPYDGMEMSRQIGISMAASKSCEYRESGRRRPRLAYADPEDATLWRGLRVRIGVHHCEEATAKYDAITGRYDYYGHDVNVAARIETAARGGQILVSQASLDALSATARSQLQLECIVRPFVTNFELKGISTPMTLLTVLPISLQDRAFELPEGYVEEEVQDAAGGNPPDGDSGMSAVVPMDGSSDSDSIPGASATTAGGDPLRSHGGASSSRSHNTTTSNTGGKATIAKNVLYEVVKGTLGEILKAYANRALGEQVLTTVLSSVPSAGSGGNDGGSKLQSYAKKRQAVALALTERLSSYEFVQPTQRKGSQPPIIITTMSSGRRGTTVDHHHLKNLQHDGDDGRSDSDNSSSYSNNGEVRVIAASISCPPGSSQSLK